MKFCFLLSTAGGSPLQVGLERGLREIGHDVMYFQSGMPEIYDVLLVFNQSAHTPNYAYPAFPYYYDTPIAFIDCAEYGYFKRLPDVVGQYANTFSEGAMKHDTKNATEQTRLREYLEGRSFPYFIREFHNAIDFPANYLPIDYPLYNSSVCNIRPSREEYLRRTERVFISWGASHPWRLPITYAMRQAAPEAEIKVLEENGTPRMNQMQYFGKTRRAKCSVSFDGYGSGSFRVTEVLCRTLLLQGPLTIRTRAPLVDGETCVMYDVASNGEEFVSTNIAEKFQEAMDDPERSYSIYERGYDHVFTHLTEAATAKYVVDTIESFDWTKPTQLDIPDPCLVERS